jgi:hypothetical protein
MRAYASGRGFEALAAGMVWSHLSCYDIVSIVDKLYSAKSRGKVKTNRHTLPSRTN